MTYEIDKKNKIVQIKIHTNKRLNPYGTYDRQCLIKICLEYEYEY